MKKFLLLSLVFLFNISPADSLPDPQPVSLIQLIANPEKFDHKIVTVDGFIHIGFESDMIFLGYEDYENALLRNALWFERNTQIQNDREKLDLNYVTLTGVFLAKPISFARFAAGGITNITRASLLSELKYPIMEKWKDKQRVPVN